MRRDFAAAVSRHRFPMRDDNNPWGWKEPRSVFFIPFLNRNWPGTRFIHVIRDGRDMAFLTDEDGLRKHGCSVLLGNLAEAPDPVKSAVLWARVNGEAASYGERHMAGRYLRIKFEHLYSNPHEIARVVFRFLELPEMELGQDVVRDVSARRSTDPGEIEGCSALLDSIYSEVGATLRRFGYT